MDVPFSKEQLAKLLKEVSEMHMPFGKYGPANYPPDGLPLHQLPYEYFRWFKDRGKDFPRGRLGELMEIVYQAKHDGTEEIFSALPRAQPIRKPRRREFRIDEKEQP